MRILPFLAVCVFASACGSGGRQKLRPEDLIGANPLPMAKGAKWTYKAKIKRFDPVGNKDEIREIKWVTEVVSVTEKDGVSAYQIKGWPGNIVDGDAAATQERTLLRIGNDFMWAQNAQPSPEGARGWFSWPLADGQRICPNPNDVYCWDVTSSEAGYTLSHQTGPDMESYLIEPGTGVIGYAYVHHATTSSMSMTLVDYEKGR